MSLLNKVNVSKVERLLREFKPSFKVIELKNSARTADEAATALSCNVGAIVKSLLFKMKKTYILCLVAGDKKVSLNKLKKTLNMNDVSMASADEVKNVTGYTIGGVSPIGHRNKINVYIDNSLERFTSLFAAAGHPNCVFEINFTDLQKITKGSIKEITE